MSKNLTVQRLVLLLTVIAFAAFSISLLLWYVLSKFINPILVWLLIGALFSLTVYFVNRLLIDSFLYRRIKLIYKMIRSSKNSMTFTEEDTIIETDSLGRVENEVREWVVQKQEEIDSLKELENYRKSFLGNISHELKTPIFSVQGYIHTLLDGGIKDEQVNRRFLLKAAKNTERLETIVNDLDIIAKLEAATMQLELQSFDIKTLTQEVMDEVEVQAQTKNINLRLKNGADQSFMVEADREYIRTVLVNLIVNSIKYGKENGKTQMAFYDMENYILVEIADNGVGIAEKHLKHLFDRFYRVDKSRSRERGGSGLGLSIVKHIIEAHNQTVHVRSTEGLGTTFGFTIQKAK